VKDLDRALTLANDDQRDWLRGVRVCLVARTGPSSSGWPKRGVGREGRSPLRCCRHAGYAHALSATAVLKDTELAAGERDRLADQYATRAVELLSRAKARGYFSSANARDELDTAPELAPLRSRPDFQKLVAEVKASPPPK